MLPRNAKMKANFADTTHESARPMMTAGELIAALSKYPKGTPVCGPLYRVLIMEEHRNAVEPRDPLLCFEADPKRDRV